MAFDLKRSDTSPSLEMLLHVINRYRQAINYAAYTVGMISDVDAILDSLFSGRCVALEDFEAETQGTGCVKARIKRSRDGNGWLAITFKTDSVADRAGQISLPLSEVTKGDLSPSALAGRQQRLHRQAKERRAGHLERLSQQRLKQEEIAALAGSIVHQDTIEVASTPYIKAKGLPVDGSLRYRVLRSDPEILIVGARDLHGKIWNIEKIYPNGEKTYLKGGRRVGLFHALGNGDVTLLCEGFATALSLYEATKCCKILACSAATNIPLVAKTLGRGVVGIAGDNDYFSRTGQCVAEQTPYPVIFPPMLGTPDPVLNKGTDWNDFYQQKGRKATGDRVRSFIEQLKAN